VIAGLLTEGDEDPSHGESDVFEFSESAKPLNKATRFKPSLSISKKE